MRKVRRQMADTTGRTIVEQCGTCRDWKQAKAPLMYWSCNDEQGIRVDNYGRPLNWPLTDSTDKCDRWCRASSGAPGEREPIWEDEKNE